MKKIVLAAVLSAAATSAFAGGVEPVTPPTVVEEEASSSAGGLVVPLLLLVLIGAAVASNRFLTFRSEEKAVGFHRLFFMRSSCPSGQIVPQHRHQGRDVRIVVVQAGHIGKSFPAGVQEGFADLAVDFFQRLDAVG